MNDIEDFIQKCEKNAMQDSQIDTTDIAEWSDKDFANASIYERSNISVFFHTQHTQHTQQKG